jgi:hypothetical protein
MLSELCASHRYQMNEVGRCLDVLPVLGEIADRADRPIALVDLGTGAGLGLHLDRYHYSYRIGREIASVGEPESAVRLSCTVRSGPVPPVPARVPAFAERVGVDIEPLDLADPHTLAWLAACIPPEAEAVTRFAAAAKIRRAHPTRTVRGNLIEVLGDVIASLPRDCLVCLVDTYAHVFLTAAERARFDWLIEQLGRRRELEWVSVDPLVPLGPAADRTVQGLPAPQGWVRDNREGGLFGVVGRVSIRDRKRAAALLGRAHPSAAWLEWL